MRLPVSQGAGQHWAPGHAHMSKGRGSGPAQGAAVPRGQTEGEAQQCRHLDSWARTGRPANREGGRQRLHRCDWNPNGPGGCHLRSTHSTRFKHPQGLLSFNAYTTTPQSTGYYYLIFQMRPLGPKKIRKLKITQQGLPWGPVAKNHTSDAEDTRSPIPGQGTKIPRARGATKPVLCNERKPVCCRRRSHAAMKTQSSQK